MTQPDTGPMTSSATEDSAFGTANRNGASPAPMAPAAGLAVFVVAGILAGALSALAVIHYDGYFQLPEELISQIGISKELQARFDSGELSGAEVMGLGMAEQDPELQNRINRANAVSYRSNAALAYALVGMMLAGLTGGAAGCIRKSPGSLIVGLLAGAVGGAVLGAAGGYAAVAAESFLAGIFGIDQMLRTVMTHAAGWAVLAVSVGLSVSPAARNAGILQLTAAAVLGGLLAACFFSVGAAVIFPEANADLPVPEGSGNRHLWTGLCSLLIAVAVGRVAVGSLKSTRQQES